MGDKVLRVPINEVMEAIDTSRSLPPSRESEKETFRKNVDNLKRKIIETNSDGVECVIFNANEFGCLKYLLCREGTSLEEKMDEFVKRI